MSPFILQTSFFIRSDLRLKLKYLCGVLIYFKLGASDADRIGDVLGKKEILKTVVKEKERTVLEKKSKDISTSKRKAVEAFELPGILTDAPPEVFFEYLLIHFTSF